MINLSKDFIKNKYICTFHPSTIEEIKLANVALLKNNFARIPLDYQSFLLMTNGMIYNGVEFMGTIEQERFEKNYIFPSLQKLNYNFVDYDFFSKKIILGRTSEAFMVYDETDGNYMILDRIKLISLFEFKSLKELMKEVQTFI